MKEILTKLEWPLLLNLVATRAKTQAGAIRCLEIIPDLDRQAIEQSWRDQESLRNLMESGYQPPLTELPPLEPVFPYLRRSGILDSPQIRDVGVLLEVTQNMGSFARDFSSRSSALRALRTFLDPMPHLRKAIEDIVHPNGELRDDASAELTKIRSGLLNVRKNIESQITQLFTKEIYIQYLQDFFFTIRADRYVLPVRLDGHGRVRGKIYDTSHSEQTLFMEPIEIADMNERLVNLELEHKLEIMRILRDISTKIGAEIDGVENNHQALVNFDVMLAQSEVAKDIKLNAPKICERPTLNLVKARHPLLAVRSESKVIANDVSLKDDQRLLIVSGPNAGGKTVILKTVGLIHAMTRAGMLLPVDGSSEVFPFENIFLELGDSQNLAENLSTFAGHLQGVNNIMQKCGPKDLVLLDELAVGTDNATGAALGQAILEDICAKESLGVVTTHYANLKALGLHDPRFRSAAMQYNKDTLQFDYRLQMDIPGESLGLELAHKIGLPQNVIKRAMELRGQDDEFEQAIAKINTQNHELQSRVLQAEERLAEAQQMRGRWQQEYELLTQERTEFKSKLAARYTKQFENWREDYLELIEHIQKHVSDLQERLQLNAQAKNIEVHLDKAKESISELDQDGVGKMRHLEVPNVGDKVFIVTLRKDGTIIKVARNHKQCEVKVGDLQILVAVSDLRLRV